MTREECVQALTIAVQKRLVIYADRALNARSWYGDPPGIGYPPQGITHEDIVASCVEMLLRHPEKWDASRGNLFKYVTLLIDAEVARLANRAENRFTTRLFESVFDDDSEPPSRRRESIGGEVLVGGQIYTLPSQAYNIELDDTLETIRETDWSGQDTRRVLQVMIEEGIGKPSELALRCNIPVSRVYSIKAEIRRKLEALRPESFGVFGPAKGSKI